MTLDGLAPRAAGNHFGSNISVVGREDVDQNPDWYAFQHWYAGWPQTSPAHNLVVVSPCQGGLVAANISLQYTSWSAHAEFPDTSTSIERYHSDFDAPPNPNGGELATSDGSGELNDTITRLYPHHVSEDAYNWEDIADAGYSEFVPTLNESDTGSMNADSLGVFSDDNGLLYSSYDVTASNPESRVGNAKYTEESQYWESYPYASSETKLQRNINYVVRLELTEGVEGIGSGYRVSGVVEYGSVDLTAEAIPLYDDEYGREGWGGLSLTTGSERSSAGTEEFSFSIDAGDSTLSFSIPQNEGKATYIRDFYITSVTKE